MVKNEGYRKLKIDKGYPLSGKKTKYEPDSKTTFIAANLSAQVMVNFVY